MFGSTIFVTHHREFFNLTHVCQTLRDEFRPIYMADIDVDVWLPDLNDFLETFLDMEPPALEYWTGCLTVQILSAFEKWVDLEPLMHFANFAPEMTIMFVSQFHDECPVGDLNSIFNAG